MHPNKHIGYLKSNLCKNFTLCIYIAQCARVYFSASLPNIPWKEAALNCVYIVYFVLCILCILHCQVAKYHLKQGCLQLEVKTVEEINSFQVKSSLSSSGHMGCIASAQPMYHLNPIVITKTNGTYHLNIHVITRIHSILPQNKGLLHFKSSSTFRLEEFIKEN